MRPGREPREARDLARCSQDVPDPEIPVLSVVDLGIVRYVRCDADGRAARRAHADVLGLPGDGSDPRERASGTRTRAVMRDAQLEEVLSPPGPATG